MSEPFVANTLQRAGSKQATQDWSLEEVTLEGWCQKEKGTDELLLNSSDVSYLSEDYWCDEAKPSVFKNALVNLSEGLAYMHKKDILNSMNSNRKCTANKNFTIKSNSNITKVKPNSHRSAKLQRENQEKDKENLVALSQQTEPNLSPKNAEDVVPSNRPSTAFQNFGVAAGYQDEVSQEDEDKTLTDSAPNLNNDIKQNNRETIDASEGLKDIPSLGNIQGSAKASAYGSEIDSSNQLEYELDSDKPIMTANQRYSLLVKKSKLPTSQRSFRHIQKDDLRTNQSLLQAKQLPSTQDTLAFADPNKLLKRDSIPMIPLSQNKTAVTIKEVQFQSFPPKLGEIGQSHARNRDENQNSSLQRKPSDISETRNSSLRNVLGHAFKNVEAPPLFSLNLKGTAIGKQKDSRKENIKESVEYILGLYKSGVDRTLEKSRTLENNQTRENLKSNENLKRAQYQSKVQPLKEKVMNQEDILNRFSSKSQGRAEVGFRIKKANSDIDDRKGLILGTIKMNEVVFP